MGPYYDIDPQEFADWLKLMEEVKHEKYVTRDAYKCPLACYLSERERTRCVAYENTIAPGWGQDFMELVDIHPYVTAKEALDILRRCATINATR